LKHQKGKTADNELDPRPTGKMAADDLDPQPTGKRAVVELDPRRLKEANAAAAALTLPFRPAATVLRLFRPKSADAPMSSISWVGKTAGEKLGLYANSGGFCVKNPFRVHPQLPPRVHPH